MRVLPIYTYGFDILRKKTKPITKIDDKLIELVGNMFNTMHKANGVGLAAPQVGMDIALTVIDISKIEGEEKKKPLTLLNPKILDTHGSMVMEEGCLSIPAVRAEVERPEIVYIGYKDLDLNEKTIELHGMLSRVAQHEIDHLNGVLFIDHLNGEIKNLLKSDLKKIKKGEAETTYLLAELKPKRKLTSKELFLSRI
jgi:peptide deformylase